MNTGMDTLIRGTLREIEEECGEELRKLKELNQEITLTLLTEKLTKKFESSFDNGLFKYVPIDTEKQKEVKEELPVILAKLSCFLTVYEPAVITAEKINNWLNNKRKEQRYYWPLFKRHLESQNGQAVVEKVDRESEKVLAVLHDPEDKNEWDVRGIVLGSVQSGKTSNYSALICKAADAGYKIIIVLSGIHNDLRQQTQVRLDEAFTGFHIQTLETGKFESKRCGVGTLGEFNDEKAPKSATTLDDDFRGTPINAEQIPWLFVVKKNTTVLAKLEKWLTKHSDRPLLLIDDEADLASVNTSAKEEATATNRFIRKILKIFKRSSFVGYTATPFANIFIDSKADSEDYSKDLFPKDFIVRLAAPVNYFGPEEFFGTEDEEGLDLTEVISPADVNALRDKKKIRVPESLRKAILQFLLSSAVRLKRIEARSTISSREQSQRFESSMLVHVSHLIKDHKALRDGLREEVLDILSDLRGAPGGEGTSSVLEGLLNRQRSEVTPEVKAKRETVDTIQEWSLPASLDEIIEDVQKMAELLEIQVVNGESRKDHADRLNPKVSFSESKPKITLFIGGNKLSRGLTLPGLCVSVFLRQTNMYDTLMQMGRWFGYRDGYLDLCRLYAPLKVIDNYRCVSEAISDFTAQIDEMNSKGLTPQEFSIKVISHPGMLVTARNKMLTADTMYVGFNGQTSEQRVFSLDLQTLQSNWDTAKRLLGDTKEFGEQVYSSSSKDNTLVFPSPEDKDSQPRGRLWKRVPTGCIIEFLERYHANQILVPKDADQSQAALVDYLKKRDEQGSLNYWTVWVPGDPVNLETNPEKVFGSKFVDRTGSERGNGEDFSSSELGLKIMKTGGSEYVGVPKELYDEALARQEGSKKNLFKKIRGLSGDPKFGVEKEGFFQLYAITTERIKNREDLRSSEGQLPVISYYLWIPENEKASKVTIAVRNSTVADEEEEY